MLSDDLIHAIDYWGLIFGIFAGALAFIGILLYLLLKRSLFQIQMELWKQSIVNQVKTTAEPVKIEASGKKRGRPKKTRDFNPGH